MLTANTIQMMKVRMKKRALDSGDDESADGDFKNTSFIVYYSYA